MLKSPNSHLEQILRHFQISGKHLAEYLNVDYSLVSKWRTGARKLNQEYAIKISQLFLTLDVKYGYERIQTLLNRTFSAQELAQEDQLCTLLQLWITSSNPAAEQHPVEAFFPKNVEKCSYYVFRGSQGRRDAINTFLDYVNGQSGLNLWLFSQEDNKWFREDDVFLRRWQEKNLQILDHDNIIHVIHPVERRYKQIAESMYRWIPMHLSGKAYGYYLSSYSDPNIKITIFLAEDHIVLLGVTSEKYSQKMMTYLFTDGDVLQNARDVLAELFFQSTRMFERYSFELNHRFFSAFQKLSDNGNPVYYLTGAPILFLIPEQRLYDVLKQNQSTAEEGWDYGQILSRCSLECLQNLKNLRLTYIIPINQLERLLQLEMVMMRCLSHCAGKPLYVTQEQFRILVLDALEASLHLEHINILLTQRSMLYPYENITLFVKEKEVAAFIDANHESEAGAQALTTQESTVISSLYYNCRTFVQSHRVQDMDKALVIDRICAMMEHYPLKTESDSKDRIMA